MESRERPPEDERAFELFYRDEYDGARRLASVLTGSTTAADDIAQDSMLRVERKFARVSNPHAYLRVTVVNTSKNWARSQARARGRDTAVARERSTTALDLPLTDLDLIGRLPYRQRAVLVLRYWLDLSDHDAAVVLGCRIGTVRSLASRALAQLRREMK